MSSDTGAAARMSLRQRRPMTLSDGREARMRLRDRVNGAWIEATPLTQEGVRKVERALAKASEETGAFQVGPKA
jgi:hypothetical protein